VIGVILGFTIQASALVLAAFVLVAALRRSTAALRHWVLSAAVIAAVCLPVLQRLVPDWGSGLWPDTVFAERAAAPAATVGAGGLASRATPAGLTLRRQAAARPAPAASSGLGDLLALTWLGGAGAGFSLLLAGLARLAWLRRRARPLASRAWVARAESVRRELGIRRSVALLQTDHPSVLAAWGWRRPCVMVPRGADSWPEDDIAIVLRHELAHIARGDWTIQLLAEALRAINWFNPLLWLLPRRLRSESERACDDVVLQRGVEGPEYAERLLALARTLNAPRTWSPVYPAPSMARPSSLERRVAAMLDTRTNRAPVTTKARAAVAVLAVAIALPVAGLAVFAQSRASFKGSVLDPAARVVSGARVVLTHADTQAKYEVASDDAGQFTLADLPTGRYTMAVSRPGFMTIKAEVVMTDPGGSGTYMLKLGALQEVVTVKVAAVAAAAAAGPTVPASAARPTPGLPAASPCTDPGTTGGHIVPPKKLHDVKPLYPDQLRAGKVAGSVTVEGIVGRDGAVHDLRVIETPHADLDKAVIDAVSRWAFEPTRLNCEPVEVKITVIAKFVY
jgi:TonB family protein